MIYDSSFMVYAQSLRLPAIICVTALALILTMGFFIAEARGYEGDREAPSAEELALQEAEAEELVELDEDITAADLGVDDPQILPGNPLYAFKGLGRGFQTLFTFNPAKKAELKIKFAGEKLLEAKKLEEGGADDTKLQAALERYGEEVGRAKTQIEKLEGKEQAQVERVVKKAADSQIKHHKILGKFMKEHEEIAPEIEQKKTEAMKHFAESMARVVEPEVLQQKFEEAIAEQKGSAFRHFKHIEVLEEVKDHVPEQAKDAIQNAIKQSSKFFEEEFAAIEEHERDLFDKYMENIGGNEVRHLEAFDSLNAFADIEKKMSEEMEQAREKTRKRVEERMQSISDDARQKVFIAHLEDAKMEDLRIINELENNLDPETITGILDIKHTMEQKMREKFEMAESSSDLRGFFDEIENFHDVPMMQMMDEMEQIIPEDKKDFWQEMKRKAMSQMQEDVENAQRFGQLEKELRRMSGFDPEHMKALGKFEGEFGSEFDFFEELRKEQAQGIEERFENFRQFAEEHPENTEFFEQAEEFRLRIQADPEAFRDITRFAPQLDDKFQTFEAERAGFGFAGADINSKIEEAERMVRKLAGLVQNATSGTPGLDAARTLLSNAQAHLEKAKTAFSAQSTGEAFGQAVAAIHNAVNGIRMLETAAFDAARSRYFDMRDQLREQYSDLSPEEREALIESTKIEAPVFHDFAPPEFFHEGVICAQVITPAREITTGRCNVFPSSCIPPGWKVDPGCEFTQEGLPTQPPSTIEIQPFPARICERGTFYAADPNTNTCNVYFDSCAIPITWTRVRSCADQTTLETPTEPATTEPAPTEPTSTSEPTTSDYYYAEEFQGLCSGAGGVVVAPKECKLPRGDIVGPLYFSR